LAGGATVAGRASTLSDAIGAGPANGLTAANAAKGVNGFYYYHDYGAFGSAQNGNVTLFVTGAKTTLTALDSNGDNRAVAPGDLTVFSNGLVGMIIDEQSVPLTGAGVSGTARETAAMMLGGKAVGLEYTNFGFWEDRAIIQGKVSGVDVNSAFSSYTPFILVASSAAEKAPSPSGLFKGTVLANAYDRTDPLYSKAASLVGQANLNVTSPTTGNISFTFDNFYTLNTALALSGGAVTQSGSMSLTDGYKNTTGIILPSSYSSGTLSGQFYGASTDTNAREAVGRFDYNNTVTGVRGSFGVK
jgi:hypothetical protein